MVKATDILNSTVHSSSSLFFAMIGRISITFKLVVKLELVAILKLQTKQKLWRNLEFLQALKKHKL